VKHAKKGNKVDFNYDKLQKIQKSYDTTVNIKTTLKGIEHSTSEPTPLAEIDHNIVLDPKGEGGEGSERPRESAPISGRENIDKTIENSYIDNEDIVNITKNSYLERSETPLAFSHMPSHPSHPSPSQEMTKARQRVGNEESQAELLRKSKAIGIGDN
jgi:hypothetical protein